MKIIHSLEHFPDGQYIVYGNCVSAFSCVTGLLEVGIPGSQISLIVTQESSEKSTSYIHSYEVIYSTVNIATSKYKNKKNYLVKIISEAALFHLTNVVWMQFKIAVFDFRGFSMRQRGGFDLGLHHRR